MQKVDWREAHGKEIVVKSGLYKNIRLRAIALVDPKKGITISSLSKSKSFDFIKPGSILSCFPYKRKGNTKYFDEMVSEILTGVYRVHKRDNATPTADSGILNAKCPFNK